MKKAKKLTALAAAAAIMFGSFPAVMADTLPEPAFSYDFETVENTGIVLKEGASLGEGKTGNGLVLDGVDDYALLPNYIASESMTIMAWYKPSKLNTWGRLFDIGWHSDMNFFFAPYSGGASRTELKLYGTADTMDSPENAAVGEWRHYAVTIDENSMSLYENGKLVNTKTGLSNDLSSFTYPPTYREFSNYIGKSHYEGDGYLAGTVDDFKVYDSVLSADDIQSAMGDALAISDLELMLDTYFIENEQLIVGDTIELPSFSGGDFSVSWSSSNNDVINAETGAVMPQEEQTAVELTATATWVNTSTEPGNAMYSSHDSRSYTVYVPGRNEAPYTITIDTAGRSKPIADTMWGLFFEDINSAADGGLYAELIRNRSFEMEDPLDGWIKCNSLEDENDGVEIGYESPLNENNPTYITLTEEPDSTESYGNSGAIANGGFLTDMLVEEGKNYDFSIYVRGKGDLRVTIGSMPIWANDCGLADEEPHRITEKNGEYINCTEVLSFDTNGEWQKLSTVLTPRRTDSNSCLVINRLKGAVGDIDIDMVSLMPQDTYKGHGLRKDLMEALEAMHPKFLRFPGGCAVEGQTMDTAWNWKDTIGDVAERKEMINIWDPSAAEEYKMTYGLGFYEYFQMCEDLDMEPVPILNCGMACQVRSGSATDEEHLVPLDELEPYIQDALDLIEFANGTDPNNEWVQKRIEMGHEEPFGLKYIGIGNEQYGEIYFERYELFAEAIHEKYPEINLITTSGTASSGGSNNLAWSWANENTELADLMDEHYYESADWFRSHAYRYDNYKRGGTDVFLGEYASKGNTWYNALSEAAFMTGLERNADVVKMASYAPMFAKYENTQWTAANMIWFNYRDYVLTPNYYIQSLFSNNQGDYSLDTEVASIKSASAGLSEHTGIAVGTWKTTADFKDIKITDNITGEVTELSPQELIQGGGSWTINDDGSVSQTSEDENCTAYYVTDCKEYTTTLKARKTGGAEGFLIGGAAEDGQNMYWANIGGWSNTASKIQQVVNGSATTLENIAEQNYSSDITINDNEWYDIQLDVTEDSIQAYVNGELACSYTKPNEYGPVYSSSVYDDAAGELVIKTANTHKADVLTEFKADNALELGSQAKLTLMQGEDSDENTLANKDKIVPSESVINIDAEYTDEGAEFTYTLPANSFTILRIPVTFGEITADGSNITGAAGGSGAHALVAACYDADKNLSGVYSTDKQTGELKLNIPIGFSTAKIYMMNENNEIIETETIYGDYDENS